MNRFIIEDANKDPKPYLNASILWLRDLGGGVVVSDLKSNLMQTLGAVTDGEFKKVEGILSGHGVSLTWRRRGIPYRGNVVAAFATRGLIEELDARDGIENMLVLGWSPSDYKDWANEHNPSRLQIKEER